MDMIIRGNRSLPETAMRVRQLRAALGFDTAISFAIFLQIGPQRWWNVENGMGLSTELALIVVRRCPGITLDWLHRGDDAGLSLGMARKLNLIYEREYPLEGVSASG